MVGRIDFLEMEKNEKRKVVLEKKGKNVIVDIGMYPPKFYNVKLHDQDLSLQFM